METGEWESLGSAGIINSGDQGMLSFIGHQEPQNLRKDSSVIMPHSFGHGKEIHNSELGATFVEMGGTG